MYYYYMYYFFGWVFYSEGRKHPGVGVLAEITGIPARFEAKESRVTCVAFVKIYQNETERNDLLTPS